MPGVRKPPKTVPSHTRACVLALTVRAGRPLPTRVARPGPLRVQREGPLACRRMGALRGGTVRARGGRGPRAPIGLRLLSWRLERLPVRVCLAAGPHGHLGGELLAALPFL